MAKDTPIQTMKKIYESKDKLVNSVVSAVKREGESKDEAISRLKGLSNKKLMRMGRIAGQIADFGGKDKVITTIGSAMGRAKDSDFLAKLGTFSNGKLMDMLGTSQKGTKNAS